MKEGRGRSNADEKPSKMRTEKRSVQFSILNITGGLRKTCYYEATGAAASPRSL